VYKERNTLKARAKELEGLLDQLDVKNLTKILAERDQLRDEKTKLREALENIIIETEGYVDGAPDASAVSKLANIVQRIAALAQTNTKEKV